MATYAEIKSRAKRPEKVVTLCLTGDLQAEFEDLERRLIAEREKPATGGATIANSGYSAVEVDLARQIEELRELMKAEATPFRIRALSRKQFSDLTAKHSPRPEDKEAGFEYNQEEFPIALVSACCLDPQMSVADVEDLVDEVLTSGQWDELYSAVFFLNRRSYDVPFSGTASAILSSTNGSSN